MATFSFTTLFLLMKDKKELVIITGSNGLIGSKLVTCLQEKYQVVGLNRSGIHFPPEKAENITFDVSKEESIRAAMKRVAYAYGKKIASVVHLAAFYDFSGKPSPLYEKVTVQGTEKLLKVLQDFEVEQFIFSSTNLIYKPTEPGKKIKEDSPLEGNWDYPESKINTEEVISENRGSIKATILRLAGAYDEEGNSIPIAHQIQRIYEKQFISHFYSGDISHGNVFVHMGDLLDAFVKAIDRRGTLPEETAINIAESETPSYQELQETIGRELFGRNWETFEMPEPLAKAGAFGMELFGDPFIKPWMIDRADDHYELDISRAHDLLQWEPRHKLLETLPEIIKKLKENPVEWYKKNNLEVPAWLEKQEEKRSATFL